MSAPLWAPTPQAVERAALTGFVRFAEARTGRSLGDPLALHAWSVGDFRGFWRALLDWSELVHEGDPEPVCAGDAVETARFFPRVRLNYAENLLAAREPGDDARTAVVACGEDGVRSVLTRGDLRREARAVGAALRRRGVAAGTRVAAFARNTEAPITACLGVASIGAVWSSSAVDLAPDAVLSRFGQIEPQVLFAHGAQRLHGRDEDLRSRLARIVAGLPSLRLVVALDEAARDAELGGLPVVGLGELIEEGAADSDAPFERFAFDHPLFVLFSSGTTGAPKCIVHGAGGTLLEHFKEQRLHSDFGPEDVLYFHTSCGWMMWNWQLSALACRTAIVLFDGSVGYPGPDALVRLLARERVTVFGTSPTFLQMLRDAGVRPRDLDGWGALRALQSTGSILWDHLYDWVHDAWRQVPIQSISGGTDIVGCFVLGHPHRPLWRGESQSVSLGYDVRALGETGAERVGTGDLVCVRPFPSRPVGFLGDPDGSRFHAAYFAQHDGVWSHGDRIELTDRGTARILGRNDGTLNVRGIRIGPAEIYRVVLGVEGVAEAMALEQRAPREPGGTRIVLLVVPKPGVDVDRAMVLRIKKALAEQASRAHVPSIVAAVAELPTTHSGKKSERAATEALNGRPVPNLEALRNPASLDAIRGLA